MIEKRSLHLNNKPMPTLEEMVANALGGNGHNDSGSLSELLDSVSQAIAKADAVMLAENTRALDITIPPDEARTARDNGFNAELLRDRLSGALPKIEERLRQALHSEQVERWLEDRRRVVERLARSDEAMDAIQPAKEAIIGAYQERVALAAEIHRLNAAAPDGSLERLTPVPLASIKDTVLFAGTSKIWPPKEVPIGVLAAGMAAAPFDPRYRQGRWHEVVSERNEAQRVAGDRTAGENERRAAGREAIENAAAREQVARMRRDGG